ncbi:MAG: HAD hydrolase-like protein [Acutalibacteraceae bacterium]
MKTTVCFDLDGTVLASQKGIYHSVRYALGALSLPIPDDHALRAFLGPPLHEGFAQVCHVPPEQLEDAIRLYRDCYRQGGMFEADIYEGIAQMVRTLREQGKRCLITTSKPQLFAQRILAHFGVDRLFDGIYGSELDQSRSRKSEVIRYAMEKQHFTPQEAVLVGDRHYDVDGAKEVGMDCVGVLYGYGDETELRKAGATYIVADTQALLELLLSL